MLACAWGSPHVMSEWSCEGVAWQKRREEDDFHCGVFMGQVEEQLLRGASMTLKNVGFVPEKSLSQIKNLKILV